MAGIEIFTGSSNICENEATGTGPDGTVTEEVEGGVKRTGICIFTDLPDLTEHVMKFLPMMELNKCCRVCKCWHDIAKRVKKKRCKPVWFTCGQSPHIKQKKTTAEFADEITKFLQNLPIEPAHALVFCSTSLFCKTVPVTFPKSTSENRSYRAKQGKMEFEPYMHHLFPSNCFLTGPVTDGIVGTKAYGFQSDEFENTKAITCLVLPKLDGIRIQPFSINFDTYTQLMDKNPSDCSVNELLCIPEEESPKVVLFFHAQQSGYNVDIVTTLLKKYKDIVIGGGYTDHLIPDTPPNYEDGENVVTGVSFCGRGIKMASVLIEQKIRLQREVEDRLLLLKKTYIPERDSVCFMFACVGRGYHHYKKQCNVESKAFRKLFPKTPLFGVFGNGEIGYDFLPDYSKPDPYKDALVFEEDEEFDDLQVYHAYTTIFCMVSLVQS